MEGMSQWTFPSSVKNQNSWYLMVQISKSDEELTQYKYNIRLMYNHGCLESTIHLPFSESTSVYIINSHYFNYIKINGYANIINKALTLDLGTGAKAGEGQIHPSGHHLPTLVLQYKLPPQLVKPMALA
jgi:hypothetical protein